jgi:hypothetical protein
MRKSNLKRIVIAAGLLLGLCLGFLGAILADSPSPYRVAGEIQNDNAYVQHHLARGGTVMSDIVPGTTVGSVIWGD